MAGSPKYLLIASTDAYSGKSATILGISQYLQAKGVNLAYGKPLGTCMSNNSIEVIEDDVNFIASTLSLPTEQVRPPLVYLNRETISHYLRGDNSTDYRAALRQYFSETTADLIILEAGGTLADGSMFNLSVKQMAEEVNASVLLVARYHSLLLVDRLLNAKQLLGDRLLGVMLNDVPVSELKDCEDLLNPFLQQQGISVLGILPRSSLLRSVSVREIATRLDAKVLCRPDRLDLMVESLTIGAMNVNSALEYFRQGINMAVVTGGDRTDLQLAALETSTHCLILTGHASPQPLILSRAEDLEIPILSVDLDTLTTVEIVDQSFGQVRVQEPIKVERIAELIKNNFALDKLIEKLGLMVSC